MNTTGTETKFLGHTKNLDLIVNDVKIYIDNISVC